MKSDLSSSSTDELKSNSGDHHAELERIELEIGSHSDVEKSSTNNKHSPTSSSSSSGFSLKNPVSSFRSWVSNKKSGKDDLNSAGDSAITNSNKKVETSPMLRKYSEEANETIQRNRTNSASMTSPTTSTDLLASSPNTNRVKKKPSFSLRSNNPISLLKKSSETNNANESDPSSTDTSSTATGGGALGYFKNLVRGDKQ